MTDRVKGLMITLTQDIREDDIEYLINAIRMLKYVADVDISIAEADDHMNRSRLRYEYQAKIRDAINNIFNPKD